MEKFVVSARKYRPDTFGMVVGQASITATLKNSIKNKQLAHAYLFCGPRGVGKTTCARIFAKTINCLNLQDNQEACNKCESCTSFNTSRSFNIHELDAASNNSVDDIRNLIDQVRIPPQVGKYSIYIIDEVHMLSQSAFNAFLKTLEEPPAHAIFILATTEKHKIIPTILSRCQIFDFNRIKIDDIVSYLEDISKQERVEYETEALNVIAQKADGAMRDALSIFDQLISFSDNKILYKNVIENLNILDYDYYFKLTDSFLTSDISSSLLILDKIIRDGFDLHNFINGLSGHFRDLLVSKDTQTVQLLEAGDSVKQKYLQQSSGCNEYFIFEALKICNEADIYYKSSKNQRLHIELVMIKLCNIANEKKNSVTKAGEAKNTEVKSVETKKTEVTGAEIRNTAVKTEKPKETETLVKEDKQDYGKPGLQEQSEEPKKEIKKESKKTSVTSKSTTTSIKDALNNLSKSNQSDDSALPDDTVTDENVEIETEQKSFSQKEVLDAWNVYAETIKNDMPRIYNTLKTHQPVINNDCTLSLLLKNNYQLDDLKSRAKTEIVQFLRTELQNSSIDLEIEVIENGADKDIKPYTIEEKFKHMSSKNPSLNKLKQEFNLDFE